MSSVIMELQTSFYGLRIRPTPKALDAEASRSATKSSETPARGTKRKFSVLGETQKEQENKEESYLAKIQQNVAEKMAFLQSLGIDKLGLGPPPRTSKPTSAKKTFARIAGRSSLIGLRKSPRLQKLDPDEVPLPKRETSKFLFQEAVQKVVKLEGPIDLYTVFESGSTESDTCFLTEIDTRDKLADVSADNKPKDSEVCDSAFSRLCIDDTKIEKVVPARITALAVHPSSSVTVVFAGDKYGNLGFFKMGVVEDLVQTYRPHLSGLMCLKVNKNQPHRIFSASYDDTIRCLDIERGIFDEVFRSPDDNGVLCMDWGLHNSLIATHSDGMVSLVDSRTRERSSYALHTRKVRTVDTHPVHEWCFLTGSTDGTARLWDVRNLSKKTAKPIAIMTHHRSCSSAFFSPLTGNQILTTSFDDTLKVFDSSALTSEVKLKVSLKHNNMTGRWLTPFKAVWMPGSEDFFLVGSMEYPRRIEVFSSSGTLQHKLMGDSLTSICSLVDVHPDRFVVAGGNSSGRLHIFV